jgi:exopolysaccharide biosynthesis polyprenyl glycosylphosphotransferase
LFWRHLFLFVNVLPQFAERAVIVGDSSIAESLAMELRDHSEFGILVVGHLKGFENVEAGQTPMSREVHAMRLVDSIKTYEPHSVIVTFGERRGNLPVEELLQLRDRGVKIQDGIDLYEAITGKVHINTLRMSSLLFSLSCRYLRLHMVYERALSVVLSAIGLLLFFPVMLLAAVIIRLDSKGPVIFRQQRIGQYGKPFTLYKFRTMIDRTGGREDQRPAEKADPRFTRVGRFLRRIHIDELPQFLNILHGDMNCVGPRPFVPNQEEQCVKSIPHYARRWSVKPGATGWAQVNRGYNVTIEDNREKLAYDLYYIKNMSIGLDLLILFKTVKILVLGRGSR